MPSLGHPAFAYATRFMAGGPSNATHTEGDIPLRQTPILWGGGLGHIS